MKTTTSVKMNANVFVALTATGYFSLVMLISYITWFA